MTTYVVTAPDGNEYEIDTPDGVSEEQALAYFKSNWKPGPPKPVDQIPTEGYPEAPQKQDESRGLISELGRQVGLTARAGLRGVGDVAEFVSSPIRGALNLALPKDKQIQTGLGERLATQAGLPQPETAQERIVQDVAANMAGAAGFTGGARQLAGAAQSPVVKSTLDVIGSRLGLTSAAGAGAGQGIARESDVGPMGQLAASVAGSIAAPAAVSVAKSVAQRARSAGTVIAAARGSEKAAETLAADAANRIAGEQKSQILDAIRNRTEYVRGASPTLAESIAEQNLKTATRQTGGAAIKMQDQLTGAKGVEDFLPSAAKAQKAAIDTYSESIDKMTKPLREFSIARANVQGVYPGVVVHEIDKILTTPGKRASEVVNKVLDAVKTKIANLPKDAKGAVDANDLYTIRKEIGNTISQYSKETANWDKKLASGLEKSVQNYIDDAIMKAGAGPTWKNYLEAYSKGMQNIQNHIGRQEEAARIASMVQATSLKESVRNEMPKIPNLLSRPAMVINFVIKNVVGDANTPAAKKLAESMADPDKFAEYLRRPVGDPMKKIAERILSESVISNFATMSRVQE